MNNETPRVSTRRNKIMAYVVLWPAALFATDPSLGLWSLAWMFPLDSSR